MARCYVTFDRQNGGCRPLDDSRVFKTSHHFFRVLRRQVLISIAVRRKFPSSPSIDGVDEGYEILCRQGSIADSVRRIRGIGYTFGIQAST